MRCTLLGLLVLTAGVARAAEAPTLTAKEIADGWLMLFDGETTFGWEISGDAAVKDGALVLGGSKPTTARTKTVFGALNYNIDYSFTGSPAAGPFKVQYGAGPPLYHAGGGGQQIGDDTATRTSAHVPGPVIVTVPGGTTVTIRRLKVRPLDLRPLFNGKDLTGWKLFDGDRNRTKSKFTVTSEGWLNVKDGPGDLQTEKTFGDFVFQGECISNGKHLNSGLFFRCIANQYQNGYEMQIRNQWEGEDRTKPVDFGTGAIYRRVPARKVVSTDGEWFTMTLVAHANHFATWVNGYPVVDWTDTRAEHDNPRNGLRRAAGHLSIQGHDPTTDLSFRNLRIAELKKE